jgi:hypothetical protein
MVKGLGRAELVKREWKVGRYHLVAQPGLNIGKARIELDFIPWNKYWDEKHEALDMIPVRVGKEEGHIIFAGKFAARHKRVAEGPEPGTGIDDNRLVFSRLYLDACRVTAVSPSYG